MRKPTKRERRGSTRGRTSIARGYGTRRRTPGGPVRGRRRTQRGG